MTRADLSTMTPDQIDRAFHRSFNSDKPITEKQFGQFIAGLSAVYKQQFARLDSEIESLAARLQEFEEKGLRYVGTHKDGTVYRVGDFCTWDGSLWHCRAAGQRGRPGSDPAGWQLAVKRGQDAR